MAITRRRAIAVRAGTVATFSLVFGASAQTHWLGRSLHPVDATKSQGWASASGYQGGLAYTSDSLPVPIPVIWRGSAGSAELLDPRPFGWRVAEIHAAYGEYQVGSVQDIGRVGYAALWKGTAESMVALVPTGNGYTGSNAKFIHKNQVVGEARVAGNPHAALWNLSTNSFIDLHPAGARTSGAGATDGVRQGGGAYFTDLAMDRALIWNSSPNDYIDVTPAGSRGASVRAMTADTQVGRADFGSRTYAALWHNSAESFINLAPPEAYESSVAATTGTIHVGWARILTVGDHACAWISDSPDGFIDLHDALGPGYSASSARAVSVDGDIVTVVGTAMSNMGRQEAVMWTAVIPAPGSLALSPLAFLFAVRRRR